MACWGSDRPVGEGGARGGGRPRETCSMLQLKGLATLHGLQYLLRDALLSINENLISHQLSWDNHERTHCSILFPLILSFIDLPYSVLESSSDSSATNILIALIQKATLELIKDKEWLYITSDYHDFVISTPRGSQPSLGKYTITNFYYKITLQKYFTKEERL